MLIANNTTISPVDYANQGNSIIGIRGSGKTYSATVLAEGLMLANIPIIVFDPTGVWQNLRFGVDGFEGFPVVVAGGLHADIELTVENCTQIVAAALVEGVSLIIDLQGRSTSTKSKWLKIVSDCVEYLLEHNQQYGLRHIFIEEAAEFIPQRPNPGGALAYSRLESMARQGRNYGLGYTLINQRAEEIAKAIFEICEMVFVHRQTGKNSLKSIDSWLKYKGLEGQELVRSLPKLDNGQCWLIDNNGEQLINILPKRTFHPDPKKGRNTAPANTGTDVSGFIARIKASIGEKPAIGHGKEPAAAGDHDQQTEIDQLKARISTLEAGYHNLEEKNKALVEKIVRILAVASADEENIHSNDLVISAAQPDIIFSAPALKSEVPNTARVKAEKVTGKGQAGWFRMLRAAAMFYPKTISKQRMATLAGINAGGGTFGNYIRQLINDGLLNKVTPIDFIATAKGLEHVGDFEPLPDDPKVLIEMWCGIIGTDNGASRMLRVLGDQYPKSLTKSVLGDLAGLNSVAGTFGNYLRLLKSNSLVKVQGNTVQAADELFK